MELGKRIREYRNALKLNQDELAKKMFVTRQTISNWENDKSYPDIHSLLLLSNLFDVSIDKLIKGDVEIMEEIVNEEEIKKFDYYGKIFSTHLLILIISAVPLFVWLGFWAYIPYGIMFLITLFWGNKVEKIKKTNNIRTYKEIVAFSKGEKLDEINMQREIGKRPYQKFFVVLVVALISGGFCILMGFAFWLFMR